MIRLYAVLVLFLSLDCLGHSAEPVPVDPVDILSVLDIRVAKYRFELPPLPMGKGYMLTFTIEEYDGLAKKSRVVYESHLGMGNDDLSLLIKYPEEKKNSETDSLVVVSTVNTISKDIHLAEKLSGAVSWHMAKDFDVELGKEFILAMKVQGFDGLSMVSGDLDRRLRDFVRLRIPIIHVFKGKIWQAS